MSYFLFSDICLYMCSVNSLFKDCEQITAFSPNPVDNKLLAMGVWNRSIDDQTTRLLVIICCVDSWSHVKEDNKVSNKQECEQKKIEFWEYCWGVASADFVVGCCTWSKNGGWLLAGNNKGQIYLFRRELVICL